jgi:hypothetical protein
MLALALQGALAAQNSLGEVLWRVGFSDPIVRTSPVAASPNSDSQLQSRHLLNSNREKSALRMADFPRYDVPALQKPFMAGGHVGP